MSTLHHITVSGSILLTRTRENNGGPTRSPRSANLAIHRPLIKVIVGFVGVGSNDPKFTDVEFVGNDISCLVSVSDVIVISEEFVEIADDDGLEKPGAIDVEFGEFGNVDIHNGLHIVADIVVVPGNRVSAY